MGGCWRSSNPACAQKQADRRNRDTHTRALMRGGGEGWPYLARRLGSSRFSGGFASECWTIATREKLQMFQRRTDVPEADRCSGGGQAGGGGGGRGCGSSPGPLLSGPPLLCSSLLLPEFFHISVQSADKQHFLWLPKSRDEAQASRTPPSFNKFPVFRRVASDVNRTGSVKLVQIDPGAGSFTDLLLYVPGGEPTSGRFWRFL